jgi:hypothetical protein
MPELVKISAASAEYQARFDRPYVGLIADDRARVFEAVVTALLPFQFRLPNAEVVTTGTLANYRVIFRIPERGISFQFGAEEYRFLKEGSSWSTADEDAQVLIAAQRALMEGCGAKVESCMLTIAMHLQPLAKTREEILAPFVPEPFKALMTQRQTQTFGNHMKWADGDVLLDFSIAFANGIFVRLTSQFKGQPPLPDILAKVRSDEEALFGILGVEEAANA